MDMDIKTVAVQLSGGALKPSDGINFERILLAERRLKMKLPEPLKKFYSLVGGREMFMNSYEQILPPEKIEVRNEKLYFAEENQGVCTWAVNVSDMLVYQDMEDVLYSEKVHLESFLALLMYYNCAQGGFEYCAMTTSTHVKDDIPFKLPGGWHKVVDHSGLIIYAEKDNLLWWFSNAAGQPVDNGIYLSSRTKSGFEKYAEKFETTIL